MPTLAELTAIVPPHLIASVTFSQDRKDEVESVVFAHDEATTERKLVEGHIRQEDTASGAEPEDDVVRRVRNVLESLLIGNLGRDDAEHRILRVFNEHVDLNRRAIHPDVGYVVARGGQVVGYQAAGRTFDLAGQPMAFTNNEQVLPMARA